MFYAHGGGGVFTDAILSHGYLAIVAVNLDCVIFNVNYRKGPEVKAPQGSQDYVDAINYVLSKADSYGCDAKKFAACGVSGGGWILCGAANILAKANDSAKIKALFFETAMVSHEARDIPQDQWALYEKPNTYGFDPEILTSIWKMHATDWDKQ